MNRLKTAAMLALLAGALALTGCHKEPAPENNATGQAQDMTPGSSTATNVGTAVGRAASGAVQAGNTAASAAHSALESSQRAAEEFRSGIKKGFGDPPQQQ